MYKPHPRFLAQNLREKVHLIRASLRYDIFNNDEDTVKRHEECKSIIYIQLEERFPHFS